VHFRWVNKNFILPKNFLLFFYMLSIYAFKEGNKLDLVPLMYYVQCLLYQCLSACIFLHFLIFCFSLQEHLSLPSLSHRLAAPMPCAFYASSFYSLCVMSIQCTIPLLCIPAATHSSFYVPESLSTTATISSLFCIHTVSMHLVHALSPCFCMLSPCRVLCLIIIATLQLLWKLNPCIHHYWVLCRDSFASPTVETLHLLCYSQAQPLCCSYRFQRSSICQSPLWPVFIPLADSLRLFSSSGNYIEVSSSSLVETISGF